MRIRTRVLIATMALLTLVCAALTSLSYMRQKRALLAGIDATLRTAVAFAPEVVPNHYHDHIHSADSVTEETYLAITDAYNRLCLELDLQYLWSVLVLDDTIVFTSGTSTSKDVRNGDHASFFEEHSNPEAFAQALASMSPEYSSFHNEWGHGRMILVPRTDQHGRVYMFGASKSLAAVDAQIMATLLHSLGITALVLGVGSLACLWLASSLTRPLGRLTEALREFGRGGRDTPLEIPDGGMEVEMVTRAFNRMIDERQHAAVTLRDFQARLHHHQRARALGTLAGGIAHDFNNLLHVIMSNAALAMDEVPSGGKAHHHLDRVLLGSQRAAELVDQILTFSREGDEPRQALYVQGVVDGNIKLLRSSLPAHVELRAKLDDSCAPVLANESQLHQVVMNLVGNAVDALPGGKGTVEIRVDELAGDDPALVSLGEQRAEPMVRLTVQDTGRGMSEEVRLRACDPYFTTKDKGRGTGLGLATVDSIVRGCGGVLDIRSREGQGTTVAVYFPVRSATGEAAADTHSEGPTRSPVRHDGVRVLFVDDEDVVVEFATLGLQKLGYQVDGYTDPLAAWIAFEDEPEAFDVVVTDETMPDLSGHELARRMLVMRSATPIILCSGYAEKVDEQAAVLLGIRAFVKKPVLIHRLAVMIEDVLRDAREGRPVVLGAAANGGRRG